MPECPQYRFLVFHVGFRIEQLLVVVFDEALFFYKLCAGRRAHEFADEMDGLLHEGACR